MKIAKLPFDPELDRYLQNLGPNGPSINVQPTADERLHPGMQCRDYIFLGSEGHEITVSVIRREQSTGPNSGKRLGIYHIHGGGMVLGNRFFNLEWPVEVVEKFDAVCVTVEYRLAPQHPHPKPVEDCYAGLIWMKEHVEEFGIDPERIFLHGVSAGGGLAAGVTLLCRDRFGPKLMGQVLFAPMLDDRNETLSAHQMEGLGFWDRQANIQGWDALLGNRRGTDNVEISASPSRSNDLSRLPPAYIDVGSAETFRDENIQYAQQLWKDGVPCELHVWSGAFHGSEIMCPEALVSIATWKARMDWLERLIQHTPST